jgi:hypothetical protein
MKKNIKLLLWSFVVVPFVVAAVTVFCLNGQNSTVKSELGSLSWDSMTKIYGGGGEAGCHMAVEDCTGTTNSQPYVTCACVNGYVTTDPSADTKWANATYNVPQDGSPPAGIQNQKYPMVTGHPNCSRPVSCVIKDRSQHKRCQDNDCVSGTEGSWCTSYNIIENVPWITSDEGYCADP